MWVCCVSELHGCRSSQLGACPGCMPVVVDNSHACMATVVQPTQGCCKGLPTNRPLASVPVGGHGNCYCLRIIALPKTGPRPSLPCHKCGQKTACSKPTPQPTASKAVQCARVIVKCGLIISALATVPVHVACMPDGTSADNAWLRMMQRDPSLCEQDHGA